MTSSSDTSTNTGIRHRKPRAGERTRGSVDAMQTKFAVGVQNLDHKNYLEQLQANIDELPDAAGADAAFIALISEDGAEIETVFTSSSGFAQCKPGQLAGEKLQDWSWLRQSRLLRQRTPTLRQKYDRNQSPWRRSERSEPEE